MEFYDFPYIGNGMSSSQLTFTNSIIFQRGRFFPPTTNQGRFIGAYLGGSVPYRSLNHSSLDDGKMFTGKPSPIFDGKNPWVSGSDFPLNQSSETIQLPRATPRGPMFPTPQVDPVLASAAISACDFLAAGADRWQQGFAQPHGRTHGPWLPSGND